MTPTQYESEKDALIAAYDFQQVLSLMRASAQRKEEAAARAEAAAEAARLAANRERWGTIYSDVKRQLPTWAQPFLVPHTDFQTDAPRPGGTAALNLELPFEAGPWPITIRIAWGNAPKAADPQFWKIEGDYYHPEPYAVSYPSAYMDDDGEWQMSYRAAQFSALSDAVLYAADAPARDAELRAENAAKNAEHARQAEAFYEAHHAAPAATVPPVPTCTAAERALLDALSAVISESGGGEQ